MKRKCKDCDAELELISELWTLGHSDELLKCVNCGAVHHFRERRFTSSTFIQFWFDTIEHWSTGVEQYWACRIDYRTVLATAS